MRSFRNEGFGAQDALTLNASPTLQDGITPLQLALEFGKGDVAKLLREASLAQRKSTVPVPTFTAEDTHCTCYHCTRRACQNAPPPSRVRQGEIDTW